jgi:beta-N-acetylhexosaminidase
MALEAGADILLMPTDPHTAIDAVVDAVQRGLVSEARLDSSVARIFEAKARAGLFHERLVNLEAIANVVGIRAHQELAQQIAQRSLVLVKDSAALVPLIGERRRRALVISYADETNETVGAAFGITLRTNGVDRVQAFRLWPASGPLSYDSARAAARVVQAAGGTVFVLVHARPSAFRPDAVNMPDSLAALVAGLVREGLPVFTVALGSPYLINQVPSTPGYLVAWSDTDVSERAAALALLGIAEITGRLPVSLPPWAPIGAGLTRAARVPTP